MPLPSTVSKGPADTVSIVLDVEPIYPDFYLPDVRAIFSMSEFDHVSGKKLGYTIGALDYFPIGDLYYSMSAFDGVTDYTVLNASFNRNSRNVLEFEMTPSNINFKSNGLYQGSSTVNFEIDLAKFISLGDDGPPLGSKFIGNFYSLKIVKNGVTELEIYPHLDGYFYDVVSKSIVTYEGSGITFNEL